MAERPSAVVVSVLRALERSLGLEAVTDGISRYGETFSQAADAAAAREAEAEPRQAVSPLLLSGRRR